MKRGPGLGIRGRAGRPAGGRKNRRNEGSNATWWIVHRRRSKRMKLISQPESFDSTSYPPSPLPLMLSNPPVALFPSLFPSLVRSRLGSRSSIPCFFRSIHFPSASYDVDNSDSPGSPTATAVFYFHDPDQWPRSTADCRWQYSRENSCSM